MRKFFRILLYFILSALIVFVLIVAVIYMRMVVSAGNDAKMAIALAGPPVQIKTVSGFLFRDLNKNGRLDIYEDRRRSTEERVNNLLSQMTLEEKAGMMFVPPVSMGKDGSVSEKPSLHDMFSLMIPGTSVMLFHKKINHFNIFI